MNSPSAHQEFPVAGSLSRLTFGEKVLLWGAWSSAIVDVLINIANYVGVHSPAFAIFKGLVIGIVLLNLRKIYSYVIIVSIITICILRWMVILLNGHELFILDDSVFFFRILFFVAWLLLFNEKRYRPKFLYQVLYLFLAISTVSFIGGIIGYTFELDFFKAYGTQRAGYKGIFFGENDTSVFYILAFLYSLYLLKDRRSFFYPFLVLAALLILGLGSKAALVSIIVVPFCYAYFSVNKNGPSRLNRYWKRLGLMVLCLIIVLSGALTYFYIGLDQSEGVMEYAQFYSVMNEYGIVTALLTGRDFKVMAYFDSVQSVFDLLFGLQVNTYFGELIDGNFMIEIDLFDYLARVGVIGTALVIHAILRTSGRLFGSYDKAEIKALLTLVVLLGATMGHTLLSAMNGMWIAFFLTYYSLSEYSRLPRKFVRGAA